MNRKYFSSNRLRSTLEIFKYEDDQIIRSKFLKPRLLESQEIHNSVPFFFSFDGETEKGKSDRIIEEEERVAKAKQAFLSQLVN